MTKLAAVAANFTRDLEQNYALIESLAQQAREEGVDFLVLPEAAIGGYLSSLGNHGDTVKTTSKSLPPAIRIDGPEIARVQEIVGDLLIAIGFCELAEDGETRYNAAAVLDGSQVYGTYRKVHQPLGEGMSYSAGSDYGVFDTPVGRVGLQICYDKAFPEAARIMALKGAQIIASLSAWPAARTATAENLQDDRWTYRFNLFDAARALDNQVFWIAANQSGTFGSLRYVGNAKVVDPGGNTLATTLLGSGMAVAEVDIDATFRAMRGGMFHLRDRRPDVYGLVTDSDDAARWQETTASEATGSDLAHA
jgi:predicted amidohydrolase